MNKEIYDLVIIGAGTAGCMAAYNAAKKGLEKIALIDRKEKESIGRKICGDGIGVKHLDFLEQLGFPIKEQEVISNLVTTAHIVSPNKEKDFSIPTQGKLAIIKRHKFGQLLLKQALEQNVKLFDNCYFKSLIREKNRIHVKVLLKNKQIMTLETPLVIDASGFNSKIRNSLGGFSKFSKIHDDEQYYCYREICQIEKLDDYFQNSAIFEFSFEKTRGGYIWFFSKGDNVLNMGTGVPKKWMNETPPKKIYKNNIASRFKIKKILDYGGGFVPTRHPLPSHVKNNLLLTGDAGAIVNPLHGGGLSASIASGYLAGEIASKKIPNEEIKEEDLWEYNLQLVERYGKRYSMLDLYRLLLQNISDKELNHAFEEEYLPLGMIFYAREYSLLLNLSQQLAEVWSTIPNKKFQLLAEKIVEIDELMNQYPEKPSEITSWAEQYHQAYESYKDAISFDSKY